MKPLKEALVHKHMDRNKTIELQDGDVVVLRNGQYKVVFKDVIHGKEKYNEPNVRIFISMYNPDLTYKVDKSFDIMTVYRFTSQSAIYPEEQYVSSDLESFVNRNLKGIIHWGINTIFERK